MIYTWLFYEFKSDQGTHYRVNINADGPTPATSGEAKETTCLDDGFTLEYDGVSQEPFQPVIGSKVTIPLYIGTVDKSPDGEIDPTDEDSEAFVALELIKGLIEENEGYFHVEIRTDPDDANELFWCGVLLSEQIQQAIAPWPRDLTLTAVDDLANLKYVDYADFEGAESFKNAIIKIIRQTRMADKYWPSGSGLFVSMVTYFNTSSAISAGNNQAYDYHRFISNEMRIAKSNGVDVPRPAGELLEAIAETFMASIFQSNGRWWVIPRAQVTFTNTSYTAFNYDRTGNNLSGAGSVILSNFIINESSPIKILSGGNDGYLHPVRQVSRDYRFSGSLKLFETLAEGTNNNTYVPLSTVLNEEFDNNLFAVLESTAFTFRWFWQITQPSNGSLTGAERVVRYKFVFKVKVGDLYLERGLTNGAALNFTVCGTTNVPTVQLLQPWSSNSGQTDFFTWETDTAARVELITPNIDAICGGGSTNGAQVVLPGLPSTEEGVTVELESVTPVDADGNDFVTSGVTPTGNNFLVSLGFWIINGNGQDTVGFQAINDNNARDTIELPEAIFGDQISTWNTRGAMRRINNIDYTTQEWRRLGSTDEEFVNQLLVNTYASIRHKARETRRFTFFSPSLQHYWKRIRYENSTWVVTSMRFLANYDEYDIDAIELKLSGTQTVGTAPNATNPTVPTQPDSFVPDLQGIAENNQITQELAAAASEKITALQPVGQTGITLKNSPADDAATTYTPPKVTTDVSVVLPLGFNWFVIINTPLIVINQEAFVTFNTRQNSNTLGAEETFITAFEGRVASVIIRSSAAADVIVKVYVNTALIEQKTSTYSAGAKVTEDFLGDDVTFNEADRISISFESDSVPTEITATLVLVQY
jgi:hypothetical protein